MKHLLVSFNYWSNWVGKRGNTESWHLSFWERINSGWNYMNHTHKLKHRMSESCWDPDENY